MGIFSRLEPGFFDDRPANFESKDSVRITGLKPGERYWAKRNGPGRVLTCRHHDVEKGWVVPMEMAYLYDDSECYREVSPAPESNAVSAGESASA